MIAKALPGKYQLQTELNIAAPVSEVWDVLADFSTPDTWAAQVTKSYSHDPKQDRGVGAGRHCDIEGFGSIEEIITEWQEGKTLTYSITPLGPLGVSYSRWSVIPVDNTSSKLTVEFSYNVRFGPIGWLMHKLIMQAKLASAFPQGPAALKKRIETGKLLRPRRSKPGQPQLA